MRTPIRIPLRNSILTLCMGFMVYVHSFAQVTTASTTPSQILLNQSFDTLVTGEGYGTYILHFPKWNSQLGKLVSISIKTETSVKYAFALRNVDNQPDTFTLIVGRKDTVAGLTLDSSYSKNNISTIGSFHLDSLSSYSENPYLLLNKFSNTGTITNNIASFIGKDQVTFSFLPVTWSNILSKNNSNYHYSATMRDTTKFSLTYYYEAGDVSPVASLAHFTASRRDSATALLTWAIDNETKGRQYEIQVSHDKDLFNGFDASIVSELTGGTAEYQSQYTLSQDSTQKYFFRIKMIDSSNTVTYSDVREIDVMGQIKAPDLFNHEPVKIYPNPATNFINVSFADSELGDWQIDILSADGKLMQRNTVYNTSLTQVNFQNRQPAGIYFVSATNMHTLKHFTGKFLIR